MHTLPTPRKKLDRPLFAARMGVRTMPDTPLATPWPNPMKPLDKLLPAGAAAGTSEYTESKTWASVEANPVMDMEC